MLKSIVIIILFLTSNYVFSQEKKKIPIPDLYNTGVNDLKLPLAGGETDPHYALVSSADESFPGYESKVVYSDGFPMNCWLENDGESKWIAPRADAGECNTPGMYIYSMSFSLQSFKPETAEVWGYWSTDNNGADILINNKSTGFWTMHNSFMTGFYPFQIKEGFIKGINVISFVVMNNEAPTGLRVVIRGEAEPDEFAGK
jgi:hypothetical protein